MINILIAIILDLLLADPYNWFHPVKLMGSIIYFEEDLARRIFKSEKGLKFAGFLISISNMLLGYFSIRLILKILLGKKILYNIFSIYIIYTCLSARSLDLEASRVMEELDRGLDYGRKRVAYIVGRDTSSLSEEEIIKATIETVAENTSDGVIGPLLYIVLLGPAGGVLYKFVNTMDSTLGYMDDKYKDIGYFPAKIDDLFNLIPARLTGLLMLISSLGKYDVKNGYKIFKRDRKNHKSPNSAYPESATAGLLGVRLGGDGYYHGKLIRKPTIGDGLVKTSKMLVYDSISIMYRTKFLFIVIYMIIFALFKFI